MKRKFWNWIRDENEDTRTLYLNGEISDETWYGDEVTPELFRSELSNFMNAESWFNARKAVELGFADEILTDTGTERKDKNGVAAGMMFSRAAVTNSLLNKLVPKSDEKKTPVEQLEKRLQLITH